MRLPGVVIEEGVVDRDTQQLFISIGALKRATWKEQEVQVVQEAEKDENNPPYKLRMKEGSEPVIEPMARGNPERQQITSDLENGHRL